jgi:chromosome segregation ATPase
MPEEETKPSMNPDVISIMVTNAQNLVKQAQDEENAVRLQIEGYKKTIDELDSEIKSKQEELVSFNHNIENANQQVKALADDLVKKTEQKALIQADIDTLLSRLDELQITHKRALEEDTNKAKKTLDVLSSELTTVRDEHKGMTQQIDEKRQALADLGDQVKDLQAQVETKNTEIAQFVSDKTSKQAEVDNLNSLIEARGTEITFLEAKIKDLLASETEVQSSLSSIQDQIEAKKQELATVQASIDKGNADIKANNEKIFNISKREEEVASREVYIKDCYNKAGITMPPFTN